jgi:ABC-type nitrate/sulfonate/bicarbonate transport system permease component
MSTTKETPSGVRAFAKTFTKRLFTPNKFMDGSTFYGLGFVQLVILVLIWEVWRPPTVPGVLEITMSLVGHVQTYEFWDALFSSLKLATLAILGATVISLTLSYSSAIPIMRPIVTLFTKLRFLPIIGLTFIPRVLFEGGNNIRLSLLIFGVSAFFSTSMVAVVSDIPQGRFEYVYTLKKTKWQAFKEIVLIETIPHALQNLRINNAVIFTLLVLVEGISRTQPGLGTMMWDIKKWGGTVDLFALEFVFFSIGIASDMLLEALRYATCQHLEKKKGY